MNFHSYLVVLNYLSVLVMSVCTVSVATHSESKMQKLALLVCLSLSCCCIGFLFRIEAVTAAGLISGQKLIYCFVPHSMFLMLLFVLEYCGYELPKNLRILCSSLNMLLSAAVLTLDHHNLFYRSYWPVDMGDYVVLEKEYGPLHSFALLLFALYMICMVAVTIEFSLKNPQRRAYVWRLALAVAIPCMVYIVPKFLGWETDLQPVAFSVFAVSVLVMIYRYRLYDVDGIVTAYSLKNMSDALILIDGNGLFRGCNDRAATLFPALCTLALDSELTRAIPELAVYLEGKSTNYSFQDTFYEVSVRSVDEKGNDSKALLFRDTTLESSYAQMLQTQLDTLYAYSYLDELTSLQNRRSFEKVLAEFRALSELPALTVVVLDLNGLKDVNDNIGHSAGDTLLKGTADLLREVFGEDGEIFRTGGDEFFVLLPSCEATPSQLESRLLAAMDHFEDLPGQKLSLSYGFAHAEKGEAVSVDELMSCADKAMYETKRRYYEESGKERRKR